MRALEKTPVLADVGREALRLLAFSADAISLHPGDRLFDINDPAEGGYTVISGSIALSAGNTQQRLVGPGTLIGEMALLVPGKRPCSAHAAEPSRLLVIPRALFRRMLDEFPEIAVRLRDNLAARMQREHAALAQIHQTLRTMPGNDD